MTRHLCKLGLIIAAGSIVVSSGYSRAQDQDSISTSALKRRSLEELMDIDITIVARQSQKWFESPAAVYVISNEDIRRVGARSIPEALRLAPNLNVAQINTNQWAISARGFNSSTANKLLVLIDGVSIYTPLFSGVFWDVQDLLLADVDRIEVISGPGGTLWGTNAVNGIINIITKSGRDTQKRPLHIEVGQGVTEKRSGAIRYSGSLGEIGSYRAYVKYFDRAETRLEKNGNGSNDAYSGVQAKIRTDYDFHGRNALTVETYAYHMSIDQLTSPSASMKGATFRGRWDHEFSKTSAFDLQSSFAYSQRRQPTVFGEDLGIFETEFQYRTTLAEAHELSWGLGIRYNNDRVINSNALAFLPTEATGSRYYGSLQDIITITPELKITLGTKVTKARISRLQFQPRLSIGWSRTPADYLWAAVSRAIRTPSRIDVGFYVPGNPPYLLAGGPGFQIEKLVAYEAGYRVQPNTNLLFDVALFYNFYDDLRSVEPSTPWTIQNGLEAKTYGGELSVTTQVLPWWRVRGGYSHLQKFITLKPWSKDVNNGSGEGNDFKHRVIVESLMNFADHWELDLFFRFVDKLPNPNAFVPAYTSLNCRIGYNPSESIMVSLLAQNLFTPRHAEFGAPQSRQLIGREVYASISINL